MSLRTRLGFQAEPLYLMDGSAFIFRSFYAYRTMSRSDGFPTNVIYMVARLILKLIREEKPRQFVFVMDGKGVTFRHERFPAYKAQRSATPEPLVQQLAPLKRLLELLGMPIIVSEGCEADDCIASLSRRNRDSRPVVIIGADKDLKQCLHANVVLWDPASKDEKITTLEDFRAETGMEPSSWPDYQALVGDSSDNIPGVPKIGPKTADELMRDFPTLEELFDRLPAVPPKVRAKLDGQRENAFLYRELTRLQVDACTTVPDEALYLKPASLDLLMQFMAEYELRSLAREVESMSRAGALIGVNPGAMTSNIASEEKSPVKAPKNRERAQSLSGGGLLAGSASGPQPLGPPPVADPAAQSGQAGQLQGSLLGISPNTGAESKNGPQPDAELEVLTCPAISSAEELPAFEKDTEGRTLLAILDLPDLPETGLLLASGDWERIYTGEVAALVTKLTPALPWDHVLCVTGDSKALCKAHPELWQIPARDFFDLSLAAYLLSPEDRGYSWPQVTARFAEQSGSPHSAAGHPGLLALDLGRFMEEQLAGAGLRDIFRSLELPLVPVLASMEVRGVRVNKEAFADFLDEVQKELDRLTSHIYNLAGREFNIRSSQQLADVLFSVLDLPTTGKTKGGATSTSQENLEKLSGKHPIIEAILDYRKLEKLRSTYLEPLPRLADSESRIHTTFNQTATATGRLSSSNPNLQNIPVRGAFGGRMRACFTSPPGRLLVGADYSQIELRVLAHLSSDPTLLDAFRNNEDIHSRTAGLLFDADLEQVTGDMRRSAKTINFGLIYGMGAQKLGQDLHIGMKEAKAFIDRYFERFAKLKEFYDAIENEARENGFVSTMAGRRRFTPDILSQNNQLRSQARRQAINTRIQGSAADIIKLAMLAVENDPELHDRGARLLLQIHDELLLEAPEAEAEAVGKRLALLMSTVKPGGEELSVPLLAEWGVGRDWSETH